MKPGQWVDEGTPLFAVQAEAGPETWKAAGWLPAAGAGRIETGARVQLRLDAFPHGEYGALPGAVTHISPLSENDAFLVEIGLPDSLISDTGKTLSPGLESPATARIFTSRKRLLDRLFEVFRRI